VLHGGIEIDGVPGFEREVFVPNLYIQITTDQVKELDPRMMMGLTFVWRHVLKLG
jgi:hypothetical protein